MKPQNLQDAIKAAAAKKRNKVESGAWKEPAVKVHKMTAEEYEQESKTRRPQVPVAAPVYSAPNPYSNGGTGGASGAEILQKVERERQEFQRETREFQREKQEILNEMRAHRKEMSIANSIVTSLQKDVEKLNKTVERLELENGNLHKKVRSCTGNGTSSNVNEADIERLEERVERLERENKRLKEKVQSGGEAEIEKLRTKVERLEEETKSLRGKLTSVTIASPTLPSVPPAPAPVTPKSPVKAPKSPAPPKSPALSKTSNHAPKSPKTPSKAAVKVDPPLSQAPSRSESSYLRPHTAEKIFKYQAKDEALKSYLSHPDAPIGMYPRKTMSIETVEGRSLVFFRNKVYIPDKLREKHMQWCLDQFKDEAKEKIAEHCTWPHQDRDMSDFVRNPR